MLNVSDTQPSEAFIYTTVQIFNTAAAEDSNPEHKSSRVDYRGQRI
jgi:hypothetical protein